MSPKVTLYSQEKFSGNEEILDSTALCLPEMGDRVSSIIVHEGTWTIYSGKNCTGVSYVLTPNKYPNHTAWSGKDNNISSISYMQDSKVTLFENEKFVGKDRKLTAAVSDFRDLNFNDKVSSIIVEKGTWLTYQHVNFHGKFHVLKPGKYPTPDSWHGLDNDMSSIKPV